MMKRFLAAVLMTVFILSLAACDNHGGTKLPTAIGGDNSVMGTDFQKNMNQSTDSLMNEMCMAENGYYFQYNGMIYYIDKETSASTILCGKPECSHDNENCNAFVNALFLQYYDGKLYWSHNDYEQKNGTVTHMGERLHCMDLDGTNHSVVQQLDLVPGGDTSNYLTKPIIHKGFVYFGYSGMLYAVPLGDDIENAVLIYGEEIGDDGSNIINANELYYELWADGDMVYVMVKNLKQEDGTYKDTLFGYDTKNEQFEKIWQVPDKSEVGSWDTTGVSVSQWYVSDGYVYFYLSGNDIWFSNLTTGDTAKLADVDLSAGVASFSDGYIAVLNKEAYGVSLTSGGSALSGGDTLYIYGYEGNLEKELSLKKIYDDNANVTDCHILWSENGKVYIHADATVVGVNGGKTTQIHDIYYVDINAGTIEKTDWSIGD